MPGVAQRVGRGIALLYHDRDARRWVSGQQHAPAALYHPGERLGTNCTGGWVGPRAGLDGRKISSPPGFDPGRDCRVINWKWRVRKYSLPDEAHVKGNCLGGKKLTKNSRQFSVNATGVLPGFETNPFANEWPTALPIHQVPVNITASSTFIYHFDLEFWR